MLMTNTRNRSAKRTLKRMTDTWDPAVDPELEEQANALLAADDSDAHAILTGRQLKRRRDAELYAGSGQFDPEFFHESGLFVRSAQRPSAKRISDE